MSQYWKILMYVEKYTNKEKKKKDNEFMAIRNTES